MTRQQLSIFVIILLSATVALAGSTTLIRHESAFLWNSSFQLNADWLVYTRGHFQTQAYTLWETSSHKWKEFNVAVAPVFAIPHASLSFPVGIRLHPEEGWQVSHAITKVNVFGRAGNFPFFLINDLSWGVGGKGNDVGKNKHFIQQQLAWQPKDSRIGLGIQSEQVLSGSQAVSMKVGLVLKLIYAKSTNWSWTVDVLPFYDAKQKDTGVKLNFLTFHFGR